METIFTGKNFKITTDESGEYKMEWDWKTFVKNKQLKTNLNQTTPMNS